MIRTLLGAAALLVAVPAAGQTPAQPYGQAVAARLAGNPAEAVRLLEPIVAADRRNADAQVQLGYALLALDRLERAEQAFRAALVAAPDYSDARLGLARIAQRRGRTDAALRELEPLGTNAEAVALRAQLQAQEPVLPWSLDIEGNLTAVDGAQDWREGAVQLRRRLSPRASAGARIEVARRFGATDVYGEASAEGALGQRARGYLLVGGTPNADFRPQWQIGAGGSLRLSEGGSATVATLDLRHAEFASGKVDTVVPGIEQYFSGGRAWLTARMINVFDDGDHQTGFLVRGDALVRDDLRVYAGYSDAPDTSEGFVIDTRSLFGGISYDLGPRTTLRASLSMDRPDTGFDRTQFGLGLGLRF